VKGRNLRQLIHVEAGSNFIIEGIKGESINSSYSASSQMPSALVACYGCRDFEIRDTKSETGDILLYAGVEGGKYLVPSSNFTLSDVYLGDGNLKTEMGGINSYACLKRVTVKNGIVHFQGAVSKLYAHNLNIRHLGTALKQRPDFLEGSLKGFKPSVTLSRISKLHDT
jgi:colanic acid biosynthesis protein WcaM